VGNFVLVHLWLLTVIPDRHVMLAKRLLAVNAS
jgi:hypothetical protein